MQALVAAYSLVSRLETPWDTVARLAMSEVRPGILEIDYPVLTLTFSFSLP
jgi:hypothetical protein